MKAKPVIIIVGTLIIGFILGMLTSAQIRYHKMKPVRVFFSEERFREGFYNIIQPDQQQREKLDELMERFAKRNGDLQDGFRKSMDQLMKEFRDESEPLLTKEQLARLKDMERKRMEMIKHRSRSPYDSTGGYRGGGRRPMRGPSQGPGYHAPDSAGSQHNKE